jgi:hypothetical protein
MKEFFRYKLVNPIEISEDGKQKTEKHVTVYAPRPSDKYELAILESYISRAFDNIEDDGSNSSKAENREFSEDEKVAGFEILIMRGVGPENIGKVFNSFAELLCDGNLEKPQATIGKTKFTKPLFNDLSLVDTKALLARYALNFLYYK